MARFIGVCWVPNIGGKILEEQNIREKVDGREVDSGFFRFSFSYNGKGIDVSVDGTRFASIEPFDPMGLCRIKDATGSELDLDASGGVKSDEHAVFIAKHRALWQEFRKLIDGCSAGCPCTAMDNPIPYHHYDNPFDLVAQRFARSLESTADSGFYTDGLSDDVPMSEVAKRALMDETVNSSNVLYFQRYIDMYGGRTSDPDDYRSQILCRKDKSDLARHYYSETHRIESEIRLESMMDTSNRIARGSNEVLDRISEFTRSTNELTQSTNEMSKKSDRKSAISLWVAIATSLMTFTALVVSIYTTML